MARSQCALEEVELAHVVACVDRDAQEQVHRLLFGIAPKSGRVGLAITPRLLESLDEPAAQGRPFRRVRVPKVVLPDELARRPRLSG